MADTKHSPPLSAEALAAIKARVEAATPGPWDTEPLWGETEPKIVLGPHEVPNELGKHGAMRRYTIFECGDPYEAAYTEHSPDAVFIAHARQDIPALLAEVERLREALAVYADYRNYTVGPTARQYSWVWTRDGRRATDTAEAALGEDHAALRK